MSVLYAALFVFLLGCPIMAQTITLRGQVTDQTGAVVPNATVTLAGPDGSVQTATTDEQGSYVLTGLAPGDYSLSGSAPQLFTPQPVKIALQAGVSTANLQLRVLATAQRVTVEAETGPAVSTEAANNANSLVLRGDDLQALSDDPDDLLTDLQALAGPSAGPSGGEIFVDGFSGGQLPSKESIREVRVNQNPFSPEYSKLGLGRIDIFTKPGADHYHGTIDYNFADQVWNSRNPYSAEKAPLVLNELEANLGGPIGHRASFVFDAQRNTVDNGAIINTIVVAPQTLAIQPLLSIFTVPQRFTRASPGIDYRLNDNNTLSFRYSFTHVDVSGRGIGSFDLESRGYKYQYDTQLVQLTETAVLGGTINETRFQYFRAVVERYPNSLAPEIQVLGSLNDGGATVGRSSDTSNYFEFQNYTTIAHGAHIWKFGTRLREQTDDNVTPSNFNGTFTFSGGLAPVLDSNNQPVLDASGQPLLANISSIQSYQRTLLFQQLGLPPAQIRALGGGATQFSITTGQPELKLSQFDFGVFVGDDWRVRPNLTVSLGLRYEWQTNIHDWRDFAPRAAIAWAPWATSNSLRPKTVLRAGFGMFYDRFALANILTARRFNGVIEHQYVVTDPGFFPAIPPVSTLQSSQVIEELDSNLRAPYLMQSSVSLERQLPANTTLALTYTNAHGLHQLLSNDINAPLPGTYNPNVPGSGVFPLGPPNPVFLMESAGLYNQNQLIANVNARVNTGLSLFGFYVLNKALSNTDGITTFPANPYNFAGEYGPASTDIRHRATIGGSINTRWNIRFSPYVTLQSGAPFNITAGSDLYGTTLFNGRPGIATDPNKPGLIQTQYGLLDPNPTPGEQLLPRNYGRGPGLVAVNVRLTKTFGFGGGEKSLAKTATAQNQTTGAANPALASGGVGMRSIIGTPVTRRRYNLNVGISARNVLNHTNPGPITGDITSPYFGRANQMAGTVNEEGFSENADNRRLEVQLRLQF